MTSLNNHEAGRGGRQRAFGPDSPVPHRREDALDRVRGPQVVPVFGREV